MRCSSSRSRLRTGRNSSSTTRRIATTRKASSKPPPRRHDLTKDAAIEHRGQADGRRGDRHHGQDTVSLFERQVHRRTLWANSPPAIVHRLLFRFLF